MNPLIIGAGILGALMVLKNKGGMSLPSTSVSDIDIGFGGDVVEYKTYPTLLTAIPDQSKQLEQVAPLPAAGISATGQLIADIGGAGMKNVSNSAYQIQEDWMLYHSPIAPLEDQRARKFGGERGSNDYYKWIYENRLEHLNPFLLKLYVGTGGDIRTYNGGINFTDLSSNPIYQAQLALAAAKVT
jgi:hypothetical protein